MCHEYYIRSNARERRERAEEPDEEETDVPPFLNEEDAEDVELLTDGGDE